VLVAEDSGAFADRVAALAGDEVLWRRLAANGRAAVAAAHGRAAVRASFRQALAHVLGRPPKKLRLADVTAGARERGADSYGQLVGRIREIVDAGVPADARVAVVSKGDEGLLQLGGRPAWHFPRAADGRYAGYYPADSAAAIRHLEALRAEGVQYLVFPRTAFWWLDYYAQLRQHLERSYSLHVCEDDTCLIFELQPVMSERPGSGLPGGWSTCPIQ
jgi:hypothetical protein